MLKHFDLFSGYGGFTLALERAYVDCINGKKDGGVKKNTQGKHEERQRLVAKEGEDISSKDGRNGKLRDNRAKQGMPATVGFSEIDKYASAVLKYHWPNIKNYGDITKINWAEVPDFDLLTGGSPCQDLSIAGKRLGLNGRRSGLFYEFMRAVREKKPKYFIWENVKGALSSNRGFDFLAVINEMAEAGYSLWWQVLNAKDFGVPQNRERIFVVGFRDRPAPEVFFEPGSSEQNLKEITSNVSDAQRIYESDGLAKSQKALGGGLGAKTGLYDVNSTIRRLTPTECERLMGLPDGWTSAGGTMSDSQRYKMCGNGVVVNVVEEIIKNIIKDVLVID